MSETKKNHYIPQFYIKKWKFNDNQVYCLRKGEPKIFTQTPEGIFYGKEIWDDEVEKAFAQTEGESWVRVRNKILEDKTMDKLSEIELNSFISFIFALKMRKREDVIENRKILGCVNAEFDNKYIKDGKILKEIEEIQKYDNSMYNCFLLSTFSALTPDKLPSLIKKYKDDYIYEYFRSSALSLSNPLKLFGPLSQFKRFSFGVKIIPEQDMKYGQFLTSDSPLMVEKNPKSANFGFQIIEACLMIALSPNLLVFGAKGVETFVALNNKPINIFIEKFNKYLYNNSKCIISNKKSLLEHFI